MARTRRHLEATAHHEAGHAAAYILTGRKFKHVTIKPGEDYFGRVLSQHPAWFGRAMNDPELKNRLRRYIEDRVIILSAGNVAERFFEKRRIVAGAGSDWINTFELLEHGSCGLEEVSTYHAWITARTRSLILRPDVWGGVSAMAAALMDQETLSYNEAERIYHEAALAITGPRFEAIRREIVDYRKKHPLRMRECEWQAIERK